MPRRLLSVLVLVVLSGCSGSGDPPDSGPTAGDRPTASPASPSRADPSSTPAASASASAAVETSAQVATDDVEGLTNFRSPTGNIACILDEQTARCDIGMMQWSPPAKPADCDLDWGEALGVGSGMGMFLCHGDTVFGATDTLDYDKALRAESLVCTSRRTGMTCENEQTGHGFTLSREAYRVF